MGAAANDSLVVATSGVFAQVLQSPWWLGAGAVYLLLRDSVQGQSLGKLLFGLVVINLETGQPELLIVDGLLPPHGIVQHP